ncbi:GspH/FimT family pseudopilin [Effusibacillus pohliae]|uniref:GspH/FimT family pseudopilin n=1 Tax=Effusibacillus pohliae TaxID=232270 RepID=UPI00037DBEAD|nr:GspH/FimT family protein [Effusibacillus pohliae]
MIKRSSPAPSIQWKQAGIDTGFSLLELLLVLLCLSVLLAIALPAYQQTVDYRNLKSAANQLYADLMECRSRADLLNETWSVQFIGGDGYEVLAGPALRKSVTLPKGIRIAEYKTAFNRPALGFNGKGHPLGGGSVVLRNLHGKEIRLVLYLHTGQMQLKEGSE